jgi:aldehyde:ferredoxin oxidoreductase
VHGAGTYSAVTKGPMTNLLGATQANGFFGAYLKQNGYDAIVLQGRATRWLYLYIAEGVLELRSADHLLGKDTWETEGALLQELGYKFRMLSVHGIGQAGEHLVRFVANGRCRSPIRNSWRSTRRRCSSTRTSSAIAGWRAAARRSG